MAYGGTPTAAKPAHTEAGAVAVMSRSLGSEKAPPYARLCGGVGTGQDLNYFPRLSRGRAALRCRWVRIFALRGTRYCVASHAQT